VTGKAARDTDQDEIFVIEEGVRRSLAHMMEGFTEVTADVFEKGVHLETLVIPIQNLLSRKVSIDISDPDKWHRLYDLCEALRRGGQLPHIEGRRGTQGTPLAAVKLDTLGEDA
jgi:hypothetical protein